MIAIKEHISVLRNWNFTRLWISQVCSQLTNYILSFAVLIKVFRLTESSLAVSVIIVSFGLATLFFGAFAGVYADRFDRKWILTIINFAQALTVLFYIFFNDNFWALAGITFVYSSLNQFYLPSEAPSIPDLVDKKHLLVANSYFTFTANGSMIVGFALAGPLVVWFGPSSPFFVGLTLLLLAGIATLSLPSLKPKVEKPKFLLNVWTEFKHGVAHFWNNKALHFPLLALILAQLVNGMLITLAPVFIEKWLGINLERGSFLAITPLALGILLGALLLGTESKYLSKRSMIIWGFIGMGIMIMLFSQINRLETRLPLYVLVALLAGYFNAHIFAPAHSLLQADALQTHRGRVYGALYMLIQMSATLPTFIIGILADHVPLALVFVAVGLVLTLSGFGLFFRRIRTT